jgi:hypothetical protein
MDHIAVEARITQVALQDAAHLNLREDDLAMLTATLVRNPTTGRRDGNGNYMRDWKGVTAKFQTHFAPEAITVYVLRIVPRDAPPKGVAGAGKFVRDVAVGLVRSQVDRILGKGDGG